MRRFHLACHLVVALLCGLPHQFALPHELVPVHATRPALTTLTTRAVRPFTVATTLVDTHFVPPFFLLLPFGRPPSLPHSRIRRLNSCLPHFLARASALRLPMRLAALLASVGCLRFMPRII